MRYPIRACVRENHRKKRCVLARLLDTLEYPSWPLASEDVFECHFLLVIDHTHHRSKVGRKFAWRKKYNSRTYFACFYRNSWPVTPYVKSIGYWVSMCYCLVFYCILEYCVILSLKKTFSNNQTRSSMDFGEESNEEKRIRIALNIEKISRICLLYGHV